MASNKGEKAYKTALYGKLKESRERRGYMVNWSAHTKHTLPFNYNNTRQRRVRCLLITVKAPKHAGA